MEGFLTNDWWVYVWENYSLTILGVPIFFSFFLKLLAVFNPNVPSDKIIELFEDYWPKGKNKI